MLASLSSVLAWAEENGCAAAAFDTPNLELLLAAIGASPSSSSTPSCTKRRRPST